MSFFEAIWQQAQIAKTPWLIALVSVTFLFARLTRQKVRFKGLVFFNAMHLVMLTVAGTMVAAGSALTDDAQIPTWIFGAVGLVIGATTLVFDVLLERVRLRAPRILQDVLVAILSVATSVAVASRAGANLSGLIATSAVFTAVLGFSLQDVIGNIAGGLALQVDTSIEVGDWVKVGDITGRVVEIRWRHTAIETRNWETVLIPNSVLMKSQVTVLGRREGQPRQLRRWVYFNVDWRYQPSDVIDAVQTAVRGANLKHIATEPPPNVVLMDLGDSFARYAVRYWLTDLALDDPTDSAVRTRIFFALQRANMRLALPAQAVFVTEESHERHQHKTEHELQRRTRLLGHVELFAMLSEEERSTLATHLNYAPFTHGEVITRQGADAHWLYIVEDGLASVRVSDGEADREVATIARGSFFGEMGLLTGEKRTATVVAITDVECFRLDKTHFQETLQKRPVLANELAMVLAKRRTGLLAAREGLDAETARKREESTERDLVGRIRRFFSLG